MALTDQVTTTRDDVISMVHCRHDYGHGNQITDHWFWALLGERLDDDEIKAYALSVLSEDVYTQEDHDEAIENLTEWRDARAS